MKWYFGFLLPVFISLSCNKKSPLPKEILTGGDCEYNRIDYIFEIDSLVKERDSIQVIYFKSVSNTDVEEVITTISIRNLFLELYKDSVNVDIDSLLLTYPKFRIEEMRIIKGACVPYSLLNIDLID